MATKSTKVLARGQSHNPDLEDTQLDDPPPPDAERRALELEETQMELEPVDGDDHERRATEVIRKGSDDDTVGLTPADLLEAVRRADTDVYDLPGAGETEGIGDLVGPDLPMVSFADEGAKGEENRDPVASAIGTSTLAAMEPAAGAPAVPAKPAATGASPGASHNDETALLPEVDKDTTAGRTLTVRHHERIRLGGTYPILVSFGEEVPFPPEAGQAPYMGPVADRQRLRIVPRFGGAIVHPTSDFLAAGRGESAEFWITPLVPGSPTRSCIDIYRGYRCVGRAHLRMRIVGSGCARILLVCAALAPILGAVLAMTILRNVTADDPVLVRAVSSTVGAVGGAGIVGWVLGGALGVLGFALHARSLGGGESTVQVPLKD